MALKALMAHTSTPLFSLFLRVGTTHRERPTEPKRALWLNI
jgi:hypothetical protein